MRIASILLLILLNYFALSQSPDKYEIQKVATNFIELKNQNNLLLKQASIVSIKNIKSIKYENQTIYNVVELDPKGFIIISNDKSVEPIIAYSTNNNFNFTNESSNVLTDLLRTDLKERLLKKVNNRSSWSKFLSPLKSVSDFEQWPNEGTTATEGWIKTTWHQRQPYNNLFPTDPVTNEKVLTGCVATAFAQVLNYHKTAGAYPLNSYSKYTSVGLNNVTIHIDNDYDKADFASFNELNTSLNSIKNKYLNGAELSETEISALNFLAAIMVKANFSSSSTSANIYNIPLRLKDYFQYTSCDVSHTLNSSIHSSLKSNMKLGLPALLSVQNSADGGHLIICDGYNTDDFFHLNFGWGENSPENISDVWYHIPQNIPANYNILNSVIYNIKPVSNGISISESLIELFPAESLNVSSFEITSEESISLKLESNQVLISQNNNSFSGEINLTFTGEDKKTIWVKYNATDTAINDQIKISSSGEVVDFVDIKGYSKNNTIDAGQVSGIWDDKTKPYLITGNIYVDQKQNLTINEGVTLYFLENTGLTIKDGQLNINGSAIEPVRLTTLSDNTKWEGIDILNSENDDIIKHAIITNSASSGIHASNSDPKIINSFIANNQSENGGGLFFSNSRAVIVGCIIVNNFNESWNLNYGGGLYMEDSEINIFNTTFNRNRTIVGGGIYCSNSTLNLVNSILWDNYSYVHVDAHPDFTHKELSFNIYNSKISASNCIIKDLEGEDRFGDSYNLTDFIEANNVSSINPFFVKTSSSYGQNLDPELFNWRLKKESAAINNGIDVDNELFPDVDIYGNPRKKYDAIDIGAAESVDSARFLSISAMSDIDFPATQTGLSSNKSFKLENTGVDSIWVSLNLNRKDVFSANKYLNEKGLAPGDFAEIEITYSPQKENINDTAYLVVYTTSDNFVYEKIRLTGTSFKGKTIQGGVSGVWDKENSPYIIVGNTWVKNNNQLTIEEGTKVFLTGNYYFGVSNKSILQIKGNYIDSVYFKGLTPWKGIDFDNCENPQDIDYLQLSGVRNSAAINVINSPLKLTNSTFRINDNCIRINNIPLKGNMLDIRNNRFSSNSKNIIQYTNEDPGNQQYTDTLLIVNNTFNNNKVYSVIKSLTGKQVNLNIDRNTFADNYAVSSIIEHKNLNEINTEFNKSISENIVYNNRSEGIAGISVVDENIAINNNLIVHNEGNSGGSNIFRIIGGNSEILNNTISSNKIEAPLLYISAYPENNNLWNPEFRHQVLNNIFYKNKDPEFTTYGNEDMFQIDYNLCNNSYNTEKNNLNVNPGFNISTNDTGIVENFDIENWYLKEVSACIDAGNPATIYSDKADKINPGVALFPAKGTLRNDMGAFGGNNCNYYDTEHVTICESDSYWGFNSPGTFYRLLTAGNGKDSLITINLNIIESNLEYSNPVPSSGSIVPPDEITFSWSGIAPGEELTAYKAFYSLDKKSWNPMYEGSANEFTADFSDSRFSGKTVYWYVSNYDAYCPRQSPVWHFDFDRVTAAALNGNNDIQYSVFPNPNTGKFRLKLNSPTNDILLVKIYNSLGQLVYEKNVESAKNTSESIDIANFGEGIYYLQGKTAKNSFTEKIIVL